VALGQVDLQGYFIVLANGFHKSDRIPRVDNRHVPADAFCPDRERSWGVGPKLQPGWQIHFEEQPFVSIPMFVDPSLLDTSQLVNTPFS
jgi:nitrogen fixation protein